MAENCAAMENTLRPVDAVMILAGNFYQLLSYTVFLMLATSIATAAGVLVIGILITLAGIPFFFFSKRATQRTRPAASRGFIPLLAGALAMPSLACAHGVFHQVAQGTAVLVTVEYDDGEPMSYAEVKIHPPSGGKVPHQTGRTDKNGCFAFVPDSQGEWRITLDGGMGHLIETTFAVSEALRVKKDEQGSGRVFSRWQGIAVGLGIIFGLAGFMYGLRVRGSRLTSCR
jgi:nickel transport protein